MTPRAAALAAVLLGWAAVGAAQDEASTEATEVQVIPVAVDEEGATPAEDGATQLDTIEVTASKRIKSQRDIPGSVGALRGGQLEKMQAQGMKDYAKLIPGLVYPDQGSEESVPVIRGIATSISFGATAATTGVYLDEMPFADLFGPSSIPDLNPFDLERLEVLKGPQGTLFGSGALAGAVRYIVQKPQHGIWQAKASTTFTETAESAGQGKVYAGAVNVPLFGDALAIRAVGLARDDPGVYDMNAYESDGTPIREAPDADKLTQRSARVLASWRVTDRFDASGFWFGQQTHADDWGMGGQGERPESNQAPFASPRDHDFSGGNLTLNYVFDWASVLSSTNRMAKDNHLDQHLEVGFDLESQPGQEYFGVADDKVRGWTQELRISSPQGGDSHWLEWLVGGSYLHYGNVSWAYTYLGPDRPDPERQEDITNADIVQAQVYSTNDQLATETALFGEVTASLDAFEFTVGARHYETTLDADPVLCGAQVIALFGQLCRPDTYHDKQTGLNPKFSIRYLHDRNMQAYVLAAKGFQFGGIQLNPPAPGFPESAEQAGYSFGPYKSSELWNYELGLRTEWLDRTVRFDATLFYLDWKDLQMTVAVPLSGTNATFAVIANVGGAHSEGLETSLEVRPLPGLTYTTTAAFMNAVTDVLFDENAGDGGVRPGTRLPGAPRFQWANVLSYEHTLPFFPSWTVSPALTHAYLGSSPDQIRATGTTGGYSTLDARIGLVNTKFPLQPEISLGVNNLTDVRGVGYHLGGNKATSGEPFEFYRLIQPRTTVLNVTLKY